MPLRPNLLIPGVTKAGTTSLFWYLAQHPQICAADEKEIDYFTPLRHGEEPSQPLTVYEDYFPHYAGERYLLEASPRYFYGGRRLVSRVHEALPDARLVVALRDPVDRMLSAFRYQRSRGLRPGTMTFEEFVDMCMHARRTGEDLDKGRNLDRTLSVGRYIDYLPDWYAAYGRDDTTVVFFEHLVADPEAQIRRMCAWLDIDGEPAGDIDYTVRNRTVATRSHRLRRVAEALNERVGKSLRHVPSVKRTVRAVYERVNSRRTDDIGPAGRARERLLAFYAPANAELAAFLTAQGHRDLPAWLHTDRVASGPG